jgi:hypothetical protein
MSKISSHVFFIAIAILALGLNSCKVALPAAGVVRAVDRQSTAWTVVGSVRTETFSKLSLSIIPYDALLAEAHKTYGADVDIIEIKEDKSKLDPMTKASIFKETKAVYNYKFIHNALVIKYK